MEQPPASFLLPTGSRMPSVGYGTAGISNADRPKFVEAVKTALDIGYRHIDGAWKYAVEEEIGLAIKQSGIPRSEIFITTKFWPCFARVPGLSLDLSLRAMQLEYVDLFLVHWPVAFVPDGDLTTAIGGDNPPPDKAGTKWKSPGEPLIDDDPSASLLSMWKKMEQLQREGKAKAIGVSNFTISQLEELLPQVSPDTPLCVNQVEAHPWLPNTELIDYCKSKGIVVQAYCPMGPRTKLPHKFINDPVIQNIASRRGWGAGQVLQSWAVQRGTAPLGRSSDPERMRGNLQVGKLTDEEMLSLDALDLGGDEGRIVKTW